MGESFYFTQGDYRRQHKIMKEDRLLRINDALQIIPIGRSTFWKYVAEGKLPQPIRLGKSTFWRHSDLMEWIASQGSPVSLLSV
jgi:prophage regulatory protein